MKLTKKTNKRNYLQIIPVPELTIIPWRASA